MGGAEAIKGVSEDEAKLIRKVNEIRDGLEQAQRHPEEYLKVGESLIENPQIFARIIDILIQEVSILREENEIHKINANGFQKIMQIANHNDLALKSRIDELQQEIQNIKKNKAINPVCECGHLSGDHTGNGNCSNCQCKIFKARGGGQ